MPAVKYTCHGDAGGEVSLTIGVCDKTGMPKNTLAQPNGSTDCHSQSWKANVPIYGTNRQ